MDAPKNCTVVSISDFKAHCLRLSADVARTGRKLVITRYGKPLVEITPAAAPRSLIGSVTFNVSDQALITPLSIEWNAAR